MQKILHDRKLENISKYFQAIQELEKEKLMLTAAMHLEKIRENFPATMSTFGPLVPGQYSKCAAQIHAIEAKVNEILEDIQEAKCELLP